jgi:hypothetical protein
MKDIFAIVPFFLLGVMVGVLGPATLINNIKNFFNSNKK